MKNLLALAVAVVAAALLSTGCCSTCCKKDGATAKPTASACTNTVTGFTFATLACTNQFAECTNQFSAAECTNTLTSDLLACPGVCTNKFADCCTNKSKINFAAGSEVCTNQVVGFKS